ncbi:hypothetical protein DL762_001723 [Monosporascus cannonballus]|uniref:EKC/KEOPS complex subunit BUD32 n=1 Tax=Monosporascus cannonballus TaxID=155416 RepID=A0ABY0HFI4_9PEZI|nr:hypothetical protein DL762_001723 [Monosporascus cannonballus]
MATESQSAAPPIPPTNTNTDNPNNANDSNAKPEFPLPKILTFPSSSAPELITQGAEGRLYKTTYLTPSRPCALKYRPPKTWRHPALDARLTRHRILAEARLLARCRRDGVRVPAVYALDEAAGWLALEWIAGAPVRAALNAWLARRRARDAGAGRDVEEPLDGEGESDAPLLAIMRRVGEAVGALHRVGVVHGDLTTSNMMLRPFGGGETAVANGHHGTAADGHDDDARLLDGEIVIIDFGLASQGSADEDRAVDLYVLERAFASTHPRAEGLFPVLLDGYRGSFKQAPVVLRKLEDVRMRGRKRSMLG